MLLTAHAVYLVELRTVPETSRNPLGVNAWAFFVSDPNKMVPVTASPCSVQQEQLWLLAVQQRQHENRLHHLGAHSRTAPTKGPQLRWIQSRPAVEDARVISDRVSARWYSSSADSVELVGRQTPGSGTPCAKVASLLSHFAQCALYTWNTGPSIMKPGILAAAK